MLAFGRGISEHACLLLSQYAEMAYEVPLLLCPANMSSAHVEMYMQAIAHHACARVLMPLLAPRVPGSCKLSIFINSVFAVHVSNA